jgi:hypothetical protein
METTGTRRIQAHFQLYMLQGDRDRYKSNERNERHPC